MKRLLLLLTLPLCGMNNNVHRRNNNFDIHIVNVLPGQVNEQLETIPEESLNNVDDMVCDIACMQNQISYLTKEVHELRKIVKDQKETIHDIKYEAFRLKNKLDFELNVIHQKINKKPWYKRLNCFKRK